MQKEGRWRPCAGASAPSCVLYLYQVATSVVVVRARRFQKRGLELEGGPGRRPEQTRTTNQPRNKEAPTAHR
jgi:hypothetical protein